MVGKILLIILCVILLALLAALLVPGFLRVSYESGELRVWIEYAWWTVTIYPFSKSEKTDKEGTEEQPEKEKKKRESKPVNRDQILYSLDVLPDVLVKALSRSFRKLRIEPLKIHVLVAGDDPADTAFMYGKIHAVLSGTLPVLHRVVRIREQDIQLFPDFTQNRMDVIVDAGFGIRILDILIIGLFALIGVLKWYLGFKKRADKSDPSQDKKTEVTAGADHAA